MTTETNDTVERYTISGTGPYVYSFRVFSESELTIHVDTGDLDPVSLTLTTHYTVSGVNDEDGGTITLTAATASEYAGDTLDIRSNTAEYQPTSIRNQGRFLPEIHEDALDRLNRQIQDISRRVDRKFGYPDNTQLDGSMSLRSSWANKWVYVNAGGEFEPATAINPQALSQSIIGELLYPQTEAESDGTVVADWYEPGNILRYGAVDGQDSTAAIAAAIAQMNAGGADVYIPTGTWLSSTSHRITYAGWRVIGDDCIRSIVKFMGAGTAGGFIIGGDPDVGAGNGGNFGYMHGVGLYNGGTVSHGLIIYNAGGSSFYNVFAGGLNVGFASHGIVIDERYFGPNPSPKGNNNNMRFFNCSAQQNTGSGFAWLLPGSDQNAIEFHACNSSFNDGHGMLLKGQANRVFGGIFEGNGGYGIRIGNDGEGVSTRSIIWFPYLESNTSGGVGGSDQTSNNQIFLDGLNANSSYVKSAGAENFWWEPSNTSGPYMNMGDPECYLRAHMITSGGTRLALTAQGSTTNLQMLLSGKGTGGMHLEPGNSSSGAQIKLGEQGSGIRSVLFGTVNFGANTVANVSFGVTLPNTNYRIALSANANNKTFGWTSKSTTGFTATASSTSSDTVDWMIIVV